MCDYSLGGVPNRLAVEGDRLVVKAFRTGTMGLACSADVEKGERTAESTKTLWRRVKAFWGTDVVDVPAVCVPPGALLILRDIPKDMQTEFRVQEREIVEFTQTSMVVNRHRDAIRFSHGAEVLLQQLQPGLRVTVLSLDSQGSTENVNENETVGV